MSYRKYTLWDKIGDGTAVEKEKVNEESEYLEP